MKMKNTELIKKWEKLELTAYLPTPNDVWTIGYGHTKDVKRGDVITREQAEVLFRQDMAWVETTIDELVKVELNQNQHDATASLIFNIGRTQFSKSTFLKRLNAKDWVGASEALTWWNKQGGKVLRGLVRRRADEKEYFLTPPSEVVYESIPVESITPTEESVKLKPLVQSKEIIAGVGASLAGLASLAGVLDPFSQVVLVGGLTAALLIFGGFIIWNRFNARSNGQR